MSTNKTVGKSVTIIKCMHCLLLNVYSRLYLGWEIAVQQHMCLSLLFLHSYGTSTAPRNQRRRFERVFDPLFDPLGAVLGVGMKMLVLETADSHAWQLFTILLMNLLRRVTQYFSRTLVLTTPPWSVSEM